MQGHLGRGRCIPLCSPEYICPRTARPSTWGQSTEPLFILECSWAQQNQDTSSVMHKKILLTNNSYNYSMINAQLPLPCTLCLFSKKCCGELTLVDSRCPPSHCITFLRKDREKIILKSLQYEKFNIPIKSSI